MSSVRVRSYRRRRPNRRPFSAIEFMGDLVRVRRLPDEIRAADERALASNGADRTEAVRLRRELAFLMLGQLTDLIGELDADALDHLIAALAAVEGVA